MNAEDLSFIITFSMKSQTAREEPALSTPTRIRGSVRIPTFNPDDAAKQEAGPELPHSTVTAWVSGARQALGSRFEPGWGALDSVPTLLLWDLLKQIRQ